MIMDGQTIILRANRGTVHRIIDVAPAGSVVNVKPPRRSLDQNVKLHALISDVSRAKPGGRNYPVDVWKALFLAMCGHKMRFEPALDGNGVIPVGMRTSRLSRSECSDLIECITAYAAQHAIALND